VHVAYKNANAVAFVTAFNNKKSKHFSNGLKDSNRYVISCIRQPVDHEVDKIHVLYTRKFRISTSGASSLL